MKTRYYFSQISLPGICFLISLSCSREISTSEVKLTVLNSMERIGPDQQLFGSDQAKVKAANR